MDAVIQPRDTRKKLIQALGMLETKRDKNPAKEAREYTAVSRRIVRWLERTIFAPYGLYIAVLPQAYAWAAFLHRFAADSWDKSLIAILSWRP